MFTEVSKSRLKRDNIETLYNMRPYKPKVMHVEDDILNVPLIINNRNSNHRKYNNCGDGYSMILLYDDHLSDIIITGNTYLRINIILERRGLVLSSLHIGLHTGDSKYSN